MGTEASAQAIRAAAAAEAEASATVGTASTTIVNCDRVRFKFEFFVMPEFVREGNDPSACSSVIHQGKAMAAVGEAEFMGGGGLIHHFLRFVSEVRGKEGAAVSVRSHGGSVCRFVMEVKGNCKTQGEGDCYRALLSGIY